MSTLPIPPTFEPAEIIQNTTVQWTKQISDYPASSGWSLSYSFRGASFKLDVNATTDSDGNSFDMALTPTQTATFPLTTGLITGQVWYAGVVTDGTNKFIVSSGDILIRQDLTASGLTTFDGRSFNKVMLDNIELCMTGRATSNQLDFLRKQIGDRSIDRKPELLKEWHGWYRYKVNQEEGLSNKILVTFK